MNTAHLDTYAAIWFSCKAGHTGPATIIRQNGYLLPGFKSPVVGLHNFACQFMTEDTGIGKIGLSSFKCMKIGTTDTNPTDLYNRVAGLTFRFSRISKCKMTWLIANDCSHDWLSNCVGN